MTNRLAKARCGIAARSGLVRAEVVAHHLRLFGFPAARVSDDGSPCVFDRPCRSEVSAVQRLLAKGVPIVAVQPHKEFAEAFGVSTIEKFAKTPALFRNVASNSKRLQRLRTLHASELYAAATGVPIVEDTQGRKAWLYQPVGPTGIFFVGTDLPADLVRYRQGDPLAALNRPTEPAWGVPGERPTYLFEGQLVGENDDERHTDWWCETLAGGLQKIARQTRLSILPDGAAGAIVITGDDDQASIARYAQQRKMLGSLPITYFLHPLTKHDHGTMAKIGRGRRVEYELHPDALLEPDRYAGLLAEQSAWFEKLAGVPARAVRNHGFLNDGYWGHASAWLKHGILASSNLPGLDGRVLNGSLLPARLALDSKLTAHWSILTAIGDGAVFLNGWNDRQSADCVHRLADSIRSSGIPGMIVLNLHPENVERTGGMHEAAHDIVDQGFIPWTLSECIDWFRARDDGQLPTDPAPKRSAQFLSRSYQKFQGFLNAGGRQAWRVGKK